MILTRRSALFGAAATAALLTGCTGGGSGQFRTHYEHPASPEVSRGWRVVAVDVNVPQSLKVSEEKSLLPKADIVWREDPDTGDRHEQVRVILENAAKAGAAGLRGSRPVRLTMDVSRFHALTFEAETRLSNAGVHNIDFVAQVTDANTGEVLLGPERIEAALPAYSGEQMVAARAKGQTQKSMISSHIKATIAAWLGAGPDVRNSFSRSGG